MRLTRRSAVGAVAAAAAVSSVLVPLTATPASAATTTELAFYVADTDLDGYYGLYQRPAAGGAGTAVVAESQSLDVYQVAASADGSRVVYVQDKYDANGDMYRQQVIVRDAGGRLIRAVDDFATDGSLYDFSPALSPDGSTLSWVRVDFNTGAESVRKAAVVSGASTQLATGSIQAAAPAVVFADPTTLLVSSVASAPFTIATAGGTHHAVTGLPSTASELTVSRVGTIAWSKDTTPAGTFVGTADIEVAPLSVSGNVATLGTAVQVATGLENTTPAFSQDGATVFFTKYDGQGGEGDIWTTPAAGPASSATEQTTAGIDELDVAVAAVDDTAPAAPTFAPAVLNGTGATLKWSLPADTDLSGVALRRYAGTTLQKTVFLAGPPTSYADTGLTLGSTYRYELEAVDRSGNVSALDTRQLTAVQLRFTVSDPTSTTATRAPFPVRFAATAPSDVLFTVKYRYTGQPTYQPWVTATAGAVRTFGSAATTGVAATTSTPGLTYQFQGLATDAYGNSTPGVTSGGATVPYDQTKATLYGGRNLTQAADYYGYVRILSATSHYAKIAITGNRFQVIGQRCTTCGVFDVYDGPTRVASIDTRASSTQYRAVLYTRTYSAVGNHTLTIRPRGTAGRPNVVLDGFAVRR